MSLNKDKEIIFVNENIARINCNGETEGVNEGGHPKVYYSFEGKDKLHCHYCGRAFVKKK